jgi:tetratricopeptide (TPR) repeat protein
MIEAASLDKRIARCEKILKSDNTSQVFAPLADALRMRGDLDQAFRICRQGLRTHPDYGAGHLVMAKINLDRKMTDWAEQELEEAVRLDGESRASEQLRVEILIAKGDLGQAQKLLGKLQAIGGNPLYINSLEERIKRESRRRARTQIPRPSRAAVAAPAESPEPEPEPEAVDSPYTVSRALDELAEEEGVKFVLCAHPDGVLVDHRGESAISPEEIAALSVEMLRASDTEEVNQQFGPAVQLTVDTDLTAMIMLKLRRYHIFVLCDISANSGTLRLKIAEIAAKLD